jgi:hypothetical protein
MVISLFYFPSNCLFRIDPGNGLLDDGTAVAGDRWIMRK